MRERRYLPHLQTHETSCLPFSSGTDREIEQLLSEHSISLTVDEARRVSELLDRDPTLVEATIWGIQGSEHCSYKSSKRFLKTLPTEGPHVILGPKEDSGIVAITDKPRGKRWGLVIAHESHNHPSQIVPYEGAATGIGGVVRDVLCMGARVVGCMDALRLGDLHCEESRTIAQEVVRGIGGYGNPLGIPNLGGDTVMDTAYNSHCLVNAIAIGIVREDEVIHSYVPDEAGTVGYDIILVGKPTDRSGFGGASFASASFEENRRDRNTGAVQEPNPFLERHLLASFYALFDWLAAHDALDKVSCKDLGAGGVVCATVEQVSDVSLGAEVNLDAVHVAIPNLPPEVIACSETQERMCLICHPDLTDHIVTHFNDVWDLPSIAENARASVIGRVNESGMYKLTHKGKTVCEAKASNITCGLMYNRPTKALSIERTEPDLVSKIQDSRFKIQLSNKSRRINESTISDIFKAMLHHPNAASKAPVFLHYDKNVMGNTVVEPGEADAGVITPLIDLRSYVHEGKHPAWETLKSEDQWVGIALSADGNGRYGRISPYWQGANAAVEAMRNVAAVGATPRALTDCLNYGNPEIPEQMWALEEGVRGIADAARGVMIDGNPVPVISGNVSLYNGKPDGSAIDPTALVSCVGVIPDARKALSMQLKQPGSTLYLVGERRDECGGSLYYQILEELFHTERDMLLGANVPTPNFAEVAKHIAFVTEAINAGLVLSCHDISEGGLLFALFEMTVPQRKRGGEIGVAMDITMLDFQQKLGRGIDKFFFCETGGFILEVQPFASESVETLALRHALTITPIAQTTIEARLIFQMEGSAIIDSDLKTLLNIWENGLERALNPNGG